MKKYANTARQHKHLEAFFQSCDASGDLAYRIIVKNKLHAQKKTANPIIKLS